jgi:hypothetical protein
VTINASLAATTRQAQLTVNAAVGAVANFRVLTGDGGSNTDANFTCPVTRDTSMLSLLNKLDCTFDGSASTAPGGITITQYEWTIFNAANGEAGKFTGVRLVQPFVPCGTFDGVTQRNVTLSLTPAGGSSTTTHQITLQKANPC